MKIKHYINYDPSCLPGNYEAIKAMDKERQEIKKLGKFDKIINAIWCVDKNADICMLFCGLFHASYNVGDRWFVIDENPNQTFTLQENKDEDILYILDGCKYQQALSKRIKLAI